VPHAHRLITEGDEVVEDQPADGEERAETSTDALWLCCFVAVIISAINIPSQFRLMS
jgi:hypothetical protein